jgi:hypothetical protein
MDENQIRQVVESFTDNEMNVLYWYYHSSIPSIDRDNKIGEKLGYSGNWVYQRLKVITLFLYKVGAF